MAGLGRNGNRQNKASGNEKGCALIYCRVSTQKQEDQGTSLDSQAAACIAHAEKLGYSVARVSKEVYSGAELFDRPQLSRDRMDIRAGAFQAVIVYAIDRLSRDIAHLAILSDEIERAGAKLIFVTEELDNTPEGKLMQSVRGYVAEVERQKIRERCVRGKRQKALSGRVVRAGTTLYGYDHDAERGARKVNEIEAATVRQMYRWAAEGISTRSIIRRLREEGTPPPSDGKRKLVHPRYSAKPSWGRGAVMRILSDPTYKGEAYAWRWKSSGRQNFNIHRPESEWIRLPTDASPAIVTPELWAAAQERLKANRGDETRNNSRPDLLRGRVHCSVCGRKMRGDAERGNYRIYRCSSRDTPQGPCGSKRIPAADCESSVWQQVESILEEPTIIAAEIERRQAEGEDSRSQVLADLEGARGQLNRVEAELARLVSRAASADEDLWQIFEKEIAGKREAKKRLETVAAAAEARLAAEDADAASLTALSEYAARVRDRLADFGFAEKRLALEALNVTVCGNGRDWRLDVSLPIAGVVPTTFCSSARRVRARRCWPSGSPPSCRRSNSRPRWS
jgi:site-specific DNA recombinase